MFVCLSLPAARVVLGQTNQSGDSAAGNGAVEGVIYCTDTNEPARFATVRVQLLSSIGTIPKTSQAPATAAMTVTNLEGAFFINRLPPGEYVAMASLRGYMFPLSEFSWNELNVGNSSSARLVRQRIFKTLPHLTVEAGRVSELTLSLKRGAEIDGMVTYDDGSPAISAQISVYRFSQSVHEWQTIDQPTDAFFMMSTDDRGSFRVTGLPPGRYLVSASIPPSGGSSNAILGGRMRFDLGLPFPGRVEIFDGDTVRRKDATAIDLASGGVRAGVDIQIPISRFRTLSGAVVAKSDGHTLKEAAVQLSFANDKSAYLVAHIGADGKFAIPFVLDGDYILTVAPAPEGNSPKHSYKTVSMPIDVHHDITGLWIELPDAPR